MFKMKENKRDSYSKLINGEVNMTITWTSSLHNIFSQFYGLNPLINSMNAMDWTVNSQNSHFEALTPDMTVFRDRAFRR